MNDMTWTGSPAGRTAQASKSATWADFTAWAETTGEKYSTVREMAKVPARLGMIDKDAGLIPADLAHFERVIAPSSFASVSNSKDLKTARDRSNSRIRNGLKRYLATLHPGRVQRGRKDWDELVDYVEKNGSPPGKGGLFNLSSYKPLTTLRARCPVSPAALTQETIDVVLSEASSEKRKSVRAAITFLNTLIANSAAHPAIAALLPPQPLATGAGSSRAATIDWDSLPEVFRADCAAVFRRAHGNPETMVADMRARADAGEDPVALHAELEAEAKKRGDGPGNEAVAEEGYQSAASWLIRAAEGMGLPRAHLSGIADLMTYSVIDRAAQDQITRSRAASDLKDPEKSQTLGNRLKHLALLARYGLRSEDLAKHVDLVARLNAPCVVEPGRDGLVEEIDAYCRQLQRTPAMAVALVNAPATLAAKAEAMLEAARARKHAGQELSALRLYASAVMFAVQMSRPLRTSNLIRMRHRSCETAKGHLTWIKDGSHAELRFPKGEIKKGETVTVHLFGADAAVLWRWMTELRGRYVELRDIPDSAYILPGTALPRLTKNGVVLPRGCLAPSSADEIWDDGAAEIGVALTPHMARHSVATLVLAMEPGNFAKCASVLGNLEDTVRKHYGRDSGAAAAVEVRKALLERHPDLFNTLQRRHRT